MTLNDFYTRTLRKLKVVPPNGAALAEDRQRVVDAYPQLHATLLSENMVRWALTEDIPEKYAIPMIQLMAYAVADDFSVPQEDYMKLRADGELLQTPPSAGERQLRKLLANAYVSDPVESDYY